MANRLFPCATILLALYSAQPAFGFDEPPPTVPAAQNQIDEIKVALFSHRRTPHLYWRIDSNGTVEVSTPDAVGYTTATPILAEPEYHIAPGTHSFDIGKNGLVALRSYLAEIINGKVDRYVMTDGQCALKTGTRSGKAELDWNGQPGGQLHLAHECLNGTGQYYHDRIVLSWHKLAGLLHQRGAPFVHVVRQPAVRAPQSLRFTETNVWAGSTTKWQIDAKGAGWVEFSADGNQPTLSIHETNYVKAGRYHFRLDRDFHQAILRELDPYLSGTKTVGTCEDEIDTSDQPLVRMEWRDKAGKPASFASDMGCPSFAKRFGKVKLAFAELIKNRSMGKSTMLRMSEKRK